MSSSAKISSALPSRAGAPARPALPNVAGGRVATGARNVAPVQPGPVEETGASGGISYEESGLLFHDHARGGTAEAAPVTEAPPETGSEGLLLDSVFQVKESLGDRRSPGAGERLGKATVRGAIRSYAQTQETVRAGENAVGEKLSIKL